MIKRKTIYTTNIFKNIDEVKALIKKRISDDEYIDFEECHIICEFDIDLGGVSLINIREFIAWNVNCSNIQARSIEVKNLNTHTIKADYIDAWDVKAQSIECRSIRALKIFYFAFCFAYENITCKSIEGHWKNSKHFCLDGEITIKQ